jgi:hypothetical protein
LRPHLGKAGFPRLLAELAGAGVFRTLR